MNNYLPLLASTLMDALRDPIVWIVMSFGIIAGWRRAGTLAIAAGAIALGAICVGLASTRYGASLTWITLAGIAGAQLWVAAFMMGSVCRVMYPEAE